MEHHQIVIIGGGIAGLSAAVSARKSGVEDVLILERDAQLGGVLNQCIDSGFGTGIFKDELTGPEYVQKFIDKVVKMGIPYKLNTMVLDMTPNRQITSVNGEDGIIDIQADAVILAIGCRERPGGAIKVSGGNKYAGIFTAGEVQTFVNIEGYLPGKKVVILGSGDTGLLMARRMTIEGAKVKEVIEPLPYPYGLKKNVKCCLEDFGIPLKLSHMVTAVNGNGRLRGITVSEVDEKKRPIESTEKYISCDTLVLSAGLIPRNELSRKAGIRLSKVTGGPLVDENLETGVEGIFACGNVIYIHDFLDNAVIESRQAGQNAVEFINGKRIYGYKIEIVTEEGIDYTVPKYINSRNMRDFVDINFKVDDVYMGKHLEIYFDGVKEYDFEEKMLAPGKMNVIRIYNEKFKKHKGCKYLTMKLSK